MIQGAAPPAAGPLCCFTLLAAEPVRARGFGSFASRIKEDALPPLFADRSLPSANLASMAMPCLSREFAGRESGSREALRGTSWSSLRFLANAASLSFCCAVFATPPTLARSIAGPPPVPAAKARLRQAPSREPKAMAPVAWKSPPTSSRPQPPPTRQRRVHSIAKSKASSSKAKATTVECK